MEIPGIIPAKHQNRVTIRVRAIEPHSAELTANQIGIIADIAEKYSSGAVHVTSRQTIEIPNVEPSSIEEITGILKNCGLHPGSSGRFLRNIIACSRWCLYNVAPLSDFAQKLNNIYKDKVLPGKTLISLSGCDFSCMRSRTSDIGVIARAEIELTDKKCKQCNLCIKEPLGCQVDAIIINDEEVLIDTERCIRCGFCTNVCKPDSIIVKSTSFDLFIGGSGGIKPKEAQFYKNISSEDEVIKEIDEILDKYSSVAGDNERIRDVMEKFGL